MPSASYSGYLNISDAKRLHFVFVESQAAPTTDPLLIWFNGGPGCSSMLAFLQEHGPMVVDDGATTILPNPLPWNLNANVLYIESPAGVGFSESTGARGLYYNDMIASEDAFAFMKLWYNEFSEFDWDH